MKTTSSAHQDIPAAFLDRMAGLLGDEYPAFQDSLQQPAQSGLRVNSLKISPQEFCNISALKMSPVPWSPDGFVLDAINMGSQSLGKHPYHAAGLYYLQEPSAMAAGMALSPQPGERVLDLSAAPGGKATHLAALMQNRGLLVVNEIHPKRVWDLAENLERCGVTNAIITNESPQRLADHFGAYFDRLLLDAPCSGEGMFRKSPIARQEWKAELVLSCAARQSSILEQAAKLVKPGGHLAYTTCTFSVEENEGVIAQFLDKHPEFDIVPLPIWSGVSPAMPEWIGLPPTHPLKRAVRIWPHFASAEGHFIALLQKQSSAEQEHSFKNIRSPIQNHSRKPGIPKVINKIFEDFVHSNLLMQFDSSRLILDGSYIIQLPADSTELEGLKVIRPGLWVGTVRSSHFTPSHSLALALSERDALRILNLSADDPMLAAYLAGESLADHGDNGFTLVTVDGFPIGWGKRVQDVIKNYYPHGLRMRS